MDRIALIGYRGSGKSTVGPALAAKLGWRFLDADTVLEASAGRSIAEIFRSESEAVFRDLEAGNLAALMLETKIVLATGGGAILREANRMRLHSQAFVVWLDADAATCWQRIEADSTTRERRPNLTAHGGQAEVERLLLERRPHYEAVAHLRIDGTASPQAAANAIFQAWTMRADFE